MRRSIQKVAPITPVGMRVLRFMATMAMTAVIPMTIIAVTPMLMTTANSVPGQTGEMPVAVNSETEAGPAALYRLMTWMSPSFPVGAFAYSSGIEWAVEAGDIVDAASLRDWLTAMLTDGSGFCDSVFLAHAHRSVAARDYASLADIAELAAAYVGSRERHLETTAQGRAFIDIARAAWSCSPLDDALSNLNGPVAYPVAVGIVSAVHGLPVAPSLHAFLHAIVSNWISAGLRLVPLGQTDGQRILAALEAVVVSTGDRGLRATLDDLGGATFRADLASMRHETQYTRLFRS